LEYRILAWPRVYIGDVFLNQAPLFFIYIEYVNKYNTSMEVLKRQLEKHTEFEKFCAVCENSQTNLLACTIKNRRKFRTYIFNDSPCSETSTISITSCSTVETY
jgi:hypothetical protein